jgi:molybdate transport system permease protein
MDWQALGLSFKLSLVTAVILLPVGVLTGRWLAYSAVKAKVLIQALLTLPLVLPPTVLGYYLLLLLGGNSAFGKLLTHIFGQPLVFSFPALVLASLLFNLPFAIQPIQRAFEAIPRDIREAAACCGMSPLTVLRRIELPLAWTGIAVALVMTFAHTLGEFGVVLMVGGNIPGETKTIAIAIYDRVQAFDNDAASVMSAFLLVISLLMIACTYFVSDRLGRSYRS